MKRRIIQFLVCTSLFVSCREKKDQGDRTANLLPVVNGDQIVFNNPGNMNFFQVEKVSSQDLNTRVLAPAKVAATVINSEEGAGQPIVLFENPDLAGNYTQLIEHLININQIQNVTIRQRKIELDRVKDLQAHGAATGKDLQEARLALAIEETNLANEKAAIIEHETKLKAGGFQPQLLRRAKPGMAYVICDIPENQVGFIHSGSKCDIRFTAFPNESFDGRIEEIADMVDQSTRMVKLRVSIPNLNGRIKAGMFATVSFNVDQGKNISINRNALITVQAQNYVFVKTGPMTFERRLVNAGNESGNRIIIYGGLKSGEEIAITGAMQLKGLSFGY